MDIRIGIKDSPREISFDSSQTAEEVQALVLDALDAGHLAIDDAKGHRYIVPSANIAYVEIGSETARKIGFVA
ncbi:MULTISPECIES: DUF3107 domain-containing protein [Agrococcus]|uniref:ATP-binding protein n=1 Tax=Agrococcus pavilionensis RW1 TaxID=1330458 RepID=U1LQB1_9MICO|nr:MULTISPECIES: DUF3107 domain-containing protein [Agrococcus]ERG64644.1 hypothetical protein L332_09310 [Agrococcus pavilionensis RW1]MBO1769172.1 DUF3107 domain-containing protein [Agrococcus sp. TF02-05]